MIKALLAIVWRAIVAAIKLPFAMICGIVQSVGFLPAPEADFETPAIASVETEANAYDGIAAVRRWAEAMLLGMPAIPSGPYADWLSALDKQDALKIAYADSAGLLVDHLQGVDRYPDLPPVRPYTETVRWKRAWTESRVSPRPVHVEQHTQEPRDEDHLVHQEPSPAPRPF